MLDSEKKAASARSSACFQQSRRPATFLVALHFLGTVLAANSAHGQVDDSDQDQVTDLEDNCKDTFNPDQADWNQDGVGDACDDELVPCKAADRDGTCRDRFALPGGRHIDYYSNYPIDPADTDEASRPNIRRAVIAVHSVGRDAWAYYKTVAKAAASVGKLRNTLIIAPHFQASKDFFEGVPPDQHAWSGNDWKKGHYSITEPRISSFEVIDRMILRILTRRDWYPNLFEIVITGHSAGGQLVQRYAAGTAVDMDESAANLAFRYIVSNPSSYLYLDEYRWDRTGTYPDYGFGVPEGTGCDQRYNNYQYGYGKLPGDHYMARVPASEQRQNYQRRDVTYLLGDRDRGQRALDMGCAAMLQGPFRYERGRIFSVYMTRRFTLGDHPLVTVPGVGHTSKKMYNSKEGVDLLFGRPPPPSFRFESLEIEFAGRPGFHINGMILAAVLHEDGDARMTDRDTGALLGWGLALRGAWIKGDRHFIGGLFHGYWRSTRTVLDDQGDDHLGAITTYSLGPEYRYLTRSGIYLGGSAGFAVALAVNEFGASDTKSALGFDLRAAVGYEHRLRRTLGLTAEVFGGLLQTWGEDDTNMTTPIWGLAVGVGN